MMLQWDPHWLGYPGLGETWENRGPKERLRRVKGSYLTGPEGSPTVWARSRLSAGQSIQRKCRSWKQGMRCFNETAKVHQELHSRPRTIEEDTWHRSTSF